MEAGFMWFILLQYALPCAFILTVFALAAGVVAAFLRSVGGLR